MDHVFRDLRAEGTEEFKQWIDEGLSLRSDVKREHAQQILNPEMVTTLASVLNSHVWLLYAAPTSLPLYLGDHPLTLHSHGRVEGRGYGPGSYGTEVQFPLSPRFLLCMVERKWLLDFLPSFVLLDGFIAGTLDADNIAFQRSLQVTTARRFLYCCDDAFDLAREMCETHQDLRDPERQQHEVIYRGKRLQS